MALVLIWEEPDELLLLCVYVCVCVCGVGVHGACLDLGGAG